MHSNIFITGGSGYLGGDLLSQWSDANLQGYDKLFALVRTDAQAEAVSNYGAHPLTFAPYDEAAVREAIISNKINIVYHLIDALQSESQLLSSRLSASSRKPLGRKCTFCT